MLVLERVCASTFFTITAQYKLYLPSAAVVTESTSVLPSHSGYILDGRVQVEVPGFDYFYYAEVVRSEQYQVDSQRVRTYFDFTKVRQGLLEVTGRLFGLRYENRPVRIDEPLLLIHGQADDNAGTWPMQSERLFEAMKGMGGNVRLVMLPLGLAASWASPGALVPLVFSALMSSNALMPPSRGVSSSSAP